MRKTLTALAAVALTLGAAAPAHADNEVRVTFDPLDWEWNVPFTFEGKGDATGFEQRQFVAHAGEGPQWLFTFHVESHWIPFHSYSYDLTSGEGTLTAGGVTRVTAPLTVNVVDTLAGVGFSRSDFPIYYDSGSRAERIPPENPDAIVLEVRKEQHTDPTTGEDFYELKWYPSENAPRLALQNLHQVQDEGVTPEDCTVSRTLEPGDALTTVGGEDVVCVTVSDGDGTSNETIVVETGDGDDVVLVDGETDAVVKVDTGTGDDVVVVDADAEVTVDGGDGDDAAVMDDDDTFSGGEGEDATVRVTDEGGN